MERLSEARIAEMAEKLAGCDYPWVEAVADVRALLQDRVLLRGERDEARQQLQADIGPPGHWICRTCGFVLMKMKLRASDMAVGVDARPVEDICPNDGSSMRPKTWKEDALDSDRVGREQMQRADAAESALTALQGGGRVSSSRRSGERTRKKPIAS